jgi:hypothetical protein
MAFSDVGIAGSAVVLVFLELLGTQRNQTTTTEATTETQESAGYPTSNSGTGSDCG